MVPADNTILSASTNCRSSPEKQAQAKRSAALPAHAFDERTVQDREIRSVADRIEVGSSGMVPLASTRAARWRPEPLELSGPAHVADGL